MNFFALEKVSDYLKQKIVLSNNVLINLIEKSLACEDQHRKGKYLEWIIGCCFNSVEGCDAIQSKNKDVLVLVKEKSKLHPLLTVILIECKNTEQNVASNDISSITNKLLKYSNFRTLGIIFYKSDLQPGAFKNFGTHPLLDINVNALIDYLKNAKGIDDLVYDRFPTL